MNRRNIAALITTLITLPMLAKPVPKEFEAFERKKFITEDGQIILYRMLRPENKIHGKKYPLVLFLHGGGGQGTDNERFLPIGGPMFLNPVNRERYPAYVIFPQCHPGKEWAPSETRYMRKPQRPERNSEAMLDLLKELIDYYLTLPEIDKDRIYITGFSMGGAGTFGMAVTYPELFAAAVPLCGSINTNLLEKARYVKFRIYHGDRDDKVPLESSRKAYRKLRELDADVTYIEYPEVGHACWKQAFNDPDYFGWMFAQKKSRKSR